MKTFAAPEQKALLDKLLHHRNKTVTLQVG
jgi:hypothetical protein